MLKLDEKEISKEDLEKIIAEAKTQGKKIVEVAPGEFKTLEKLED